jgi:hypothetical protein
MKWVIDCEGDIGLSFWNVVTLVKYKHSVLWVWFWNATDWEFVPAPKYVEWPVWFN